MDLFACRIVLRKPCLSHLLPQPAKKCPMPWAIAERNRGRWNQGCRRGVASAPPRNARPVDRTTLITRLEDWQPTPKAYGAIPAEALSRTDFRRSPGSVGGRREQPCAFAADVRRGAANSSTGVCGETLLANDIAVCARPARLTSLCVGEFSR